jgi:lysozyme
MSKLREMLIRHEGLRLKPYKDTVGKLTIGVGRNLEDVGISKDEALALLDNDIAKIRVQAEGAFLWFRRLEPARQDVILNMIFNIGLKGMLGFTHTLDAIAKGEYDLAAKRMLESKWARQVGNRAVELARLMELGEY